MKPKSQSITQKPGQIIKGKPGTANKTSHQATKTMEPKKQDNVMKEGQSGGFMNRPTTLVCYICGREYGTRSLKIHLKTCEQKWYYEQDLRPKKDQKSCPKPPPGLMQLLEKDNITKKDLQDYNSKAFDSWNTEVLEQCITCGRTFKPDSLVRHQVSCKPGNPLKSLNKQQIEDNLMDQGEGNLNLVPCQSCGRKFASDRVQKHQSICKGDQMSKNAQKAQRKIEEKKKQYEKYDKVHQKPPSKWKKQHEDFMEGMKYMRKLKQVQQTGGDIRNLPPPKESNYDHYVQCHYCGRKYAPDVAERHIPKCKNIVNKPNPVNKTSQNSFQKQQPQMTKPPQQFYQQNEIKKVQQSQQFMTSNQQYGQQMNSNQSQVKNVKPVTQTQQQVRL